MSLYDMRNGPHNRLENVSVHNSEAIYWLAYRPVVWDDWPSHFAAVRSVAWSFYATEKGRDAAAARCILIPAHIRATPLSRRPATPKGCWWVTRKVVGELRLQDLMAHAGIATTSTDPWPLLAGTVAQ